MKLLLNKKNRGSNLKDCISIQKSQVAITGICYDRLVGNDDCLYVNVGINDEGNLCLYVSSIKDSRLYKTYEPKNTIKQCKFGVNSKEQKQALLPYVGTYEIKYISLKEKDNIKEVILKKI